MGNYKKYFFALLISIFVNVQSHSHCDSFSKTDCVEIDFRSQNGSSIEEMRYEFPLQCAIETAASSWWPWDDPAEEDTTTPAEEDATSDSEVGLHEVLTLADRLKKHIVGQDSAVDITADAMVRYSAGVNDPKKPIEVFLYVGPSGVGKTELAKKLAKEVYGKEEYMFTLAMAEFSSYGGVSRLIGSPPGYVNSDEGGQLTNFLKKKSSSVILLDEIEKADDEVRKLFLQLFDEGKITSSMGELIHCNKTIFIMTSNIDALKIAKLHKAGYEQNEILGLIEHDLMEELSPELYNRTQPVVFIPLSYDVVLKIIDLSLKQLYDRVFERKGIKLIFEDSIREYIALNGYHPELGARPVKRLIEKDLTTIIAKAILEGSCKKGSTLTLRVKDGIVCVKKS